MAKSIKSESMTKAQGLTLEELKAQTGGLLPDRLELRRPCRPARRSSGPGRCRRGR